MYEGFYEIKTKYINKGNRYMQDYKKCFSCIFYKNNKCVKNNRYSNCFDYIAKKARNNNYGK